MDLNEIEDRISKITAILDEEKKKLQSEYAIELKMVLYGLNRISDSEWNESVRQYEKALENSELYRTAEGAIEDLKAKRLQYLKGISEVTILDDDITSDAVEIPDSNQTIDQAGPKRKNKCWSSVEEKELKRLVNSGKSIKEVMKELGRTKGSVSGKCSQLGLKIEGLEK